MPRDILDREQGTDLKAETDFLFHLSLTSLKRRLSLIDAAAGDKPVLAIGRIDNETAIALVSEKSPRREVHARQLSVKHLVR